MKSNFLLICLCDLNLWRHRAPSQSGVEYGFQCTQEITGKSGLPTYFCQRVCLPCCQLWVCKRKLLIHLEKRYKKCIELRIWCKLLLLIVICSQFWVSVVFLSLLSSWNLEIIIWITFWSCLLCNLRRVVELPLSFSPYLFKF